MTAHDTYTDTEARCICGQCIESEQHDQGCYQVGATVVRMYATDLSYQFRATWFDPDTDRAMSALVNRSASTGRWYVYPFGKTGTFGYLGAAVESLFPAPHDPSGRQCAIFGQDPQAPDACPACVADMREACAHVSNTYLDLADNLAPDAEVECDDCGAHLVPADCREAERYFRGRRDTQPTIRTK